MPATLQEAHAFLQGMLLEEKGLSGEVDQGHRGEVIVALQEASGEGQCQDCPLPVVVVAKNV